MKEQCAGLIYDRSEQPGTSLIWRTNAVRSLDGPIFLERDQLPFDSYVLIDRMLQLKQHWTWLPCLSEWWQPQRFIPPAWLRAHEEWNLIGPILNAGSSALQVPTTITPEICIVICRYNNADYLLWAIRSVMAGRPQLGTNHRR